MPSPNDLLLSPLPRDLLEKIRTGQPEAMRDLLEWLVRGYGEASSWYMRRKRLYRCPASLCRWTAVVAVAATVLWLPVLSVFGPVRIADLFGLTAESASQLGYLAAAVGASILLVDKMGGLSNAWVRYTVTGLSLQQSCDLMQVRWAALDHNATTAAADQAAVLEKGARDLWEKVQAETAEWGKSYITDLNALGEALGRSSQKP
jgi:hypothetical protein